MKLKYPKVHTDQKQQVYISFYLNEKRYRLFNGKRIGSDTNPNTYPVAQRADIGNVLAAEVYDYLINGGVLKSFRSENILVGKLTDRRLSKDGSKFKDERNLFREVQEDASVYV